MAEPRFPKADEKPTVPAPADPRLIPGGSLDATPIGMNAVDREDLPSYGVVDVVNRKDMP